MTKIKQLDWPAGNVVYVYRDIVQAKVAKRKIVVHKIEVWNIYNPLSGKFEPLPVAHCEGKSK